MHTLTAASGAAIAAAAGYSESRAITSDFIRRILLEDSEGDSYLRHVRILYTDRARDFDHGDYWAFIPGLLAIASHPLHRCIEVECCYGGKITNLSEALRKIHRGFTASDTSANGRGDVSKE